jgi:hypothetical protein
MVETSRNLKDDLAFSYLSFIEQQNGELLKQQKEQMDEIGALQQRLDALANTNY